MSQPNLFDYAKQGEILRDLGCAAVEISSTLFRNDWVGKARHMAIRYAEVHGTVTSDDVHRICPLPADEHPNAVGAVFRTKKLKAVGFEQTKRTSGHARRIFVYERDWSN